MMRVFYGSAKGNAHRYQFRGDDAHVGAGLCIGIGGVRTDRAVAYQVLEAVSHHAAEAAIDRSTNDIIAAVERDLRQRDTRCLSPHDATNWWNAALEHVDELEQWIEGLRATAATRPEIDRAMLMQLAHDLTAAWNAPSTDTRTKPRLIHILIREIVCQLDDAANDAVLLIHWTSGRHTEVCVPRVKTGRYPSDMAPSAVDALRKLGGHWPDRQLAVSLNRMR